MSDEPQAPSQDRPSDGGNQPTPPEASNPLKPMATIKGGEVTSRKNPGPGKAKSSTIFGVTK